MKLLFDIETDGLDATKIWCLVAQEVDTGQVWSYGPDDIEEGVKLLNNASQLSGHNIIGFDIPVLEKLTSFKLGYQKIVDTLVYSRLFNPVREGEQDITFTPVPSVVKIKCLVISLFEPSVFEAIPNDSFKSVDEMVIFIDFLPYFQF